MKRFTLTLDRNAMEDILREHLDEMFPGLPVGKIWGLGYSEVTVHMGAVNEIEPAVEPAPPPPEKPDDEVQF